MWTLIIFGVGIPFLYPIWMPHKVASIGGWIYYHCSVSEEGSGNGEDGSMDICSMYQRGSV
jgi:hypothetical protein